MSDLLRLDGASIAGEACAPPPTTRLPTPYITVVVPTRHEATNIEPLVERLSNAIAPLGGAWEVLFVDDSDDDTPAVIRSADREGRTVRLLHREPAERRNGMAGALEAGFRTARGDVVAVIDADLQHPPETLALMVRVLLGADADIVLGSRYLPGGSGAGFTGRGRRAISLVSAQMVRLLFPVLRKTTDPGGNFFVFRREVIEGVPLSAVGFKMLTEVLVRGRWTRLAEVPYAFLPRESGASTVTFREGLRFFQHMARLARSARSDSPAAGPRIEVLEVSTSGEPLPRHRLVSRP